ncbi:hypothetical protein [Streptomyces sp. NPDC059979]|uniref:hypothetical protein n=1 Tax=Streptomyces sp. NPDC059979 TaxID=3347021 RepID=UPI0036CAD945
MGGDGGFGRGLLTGTAAAGVVEGSRQVLRDEPVPLRAQRDGAADSVQPAVPVSAAEDEELRAG